MKRFSTFIVEQDPQNDPFAKFMRDMAQNKGNYNPDEYSKLSKDQQITALKMSNQAAQAANPNPNETNQDQRNATLLQRYQDMQAKTGKSDAEINKMLKPDEKETFKKIFPGDENKPTAKPAAPAATPAPPPKPSGSDIDFSNPKLSGTGVSNLNIGAGGSQTDPSIAAQYGDKTKLRANIYQDKVQVGAEHDIDDTTKGGVYASQNLAGGRTYGAQVRKQFNKNTSGYVGVSRDTTGDTGNKVVAGAEFRY